MESSLESKMSSLSSSPSRGSLSGNPQVDLINDSDDSDDDSDNDIIDEDDDEGPPPISMFIGKFFSKVKLSLVISTTFEFSRQKVDLNLLKTAHFKASQI